MVTCFQKALAILPKLLIIPDHTSFGFFQCGHCELWRLGLTTGSLSHRGHGMPGALLFITQHQLLWDELAGLGLPPLLLEHPT